MIKVDCTKKLIDVKGAETEQTVGSYLAEILFYNRKNQYRSHILLQKFRDEKEVELKAEDVVFIKDAIKELGARAGEAGQVLALLGETE